MTERDGTARFNGRTLTQLVDVAKDGAELLRQELNLARQETIEKLTPAALSTGMILGGGLLATVGSMYILQAIVRALATRMPHWLAALLFGAVLAISGVLLMGRGTHQLKNVNIVPEKTIRSLREDKQWLLRQIKSKLI